jgi:hypothetical protein
VLRKIENDEFLHIACRDELERAVQLARELNALWPGEYLVRDSEDKEVDLAE